MYRSYVTVISGGETLSTSYSASVLPLLAARSVSVACCIELPVSIEVEGSSVAVTSSSSGVTRFVIRELPVMETSAV